MSPPSRDERDLVRAMASLAVLSVRAAQRPDDGAGLLADAVTALAAGTAADVVLVVATDDPTADGSTADGPVAGRVLAAHGGPRPAARITLPGGLPPPGAAQRLEALVPATRGRPGFGADGVAVGLHVDLPRDAQRRRVLALYRRAETPFDADEQDFAVQAGRLLAAALTPERATAGRVDEDPRRSVGLDLNDRVVQGIATAVYALRAGDTTLAEDVAARTLDQARVLVDDLLGEEPAVPVVGDLVRRRGAPPLLPQRRAEDDDREQPPALVRVLIADDSHDIRFLLGSQLRADPAFEVVGEAANGDEAVQRAVELRPDVVVLDLVMPVMDGFQALTELRERLPDTRVVVLSGLDAGRMGARAVAAGASTYLEKGSATRELRDVLAELFPEVGESPPPVRLVSDAEGPDQLAHELRTPLTVIQGFADTLLRQMDQVPAAMVREMVTGIARNTRQMGGLIDVFADAHKIGAGSLRLETEPVDLAALVRQTVGDLATVTRHHEIRLEVPDSLQAVVDPLRVRQVVTNLVSNAVKFSPHGTAVDIGLSHEDGDVVVSVADRGPGIPPELRSQLFRPYTRLGARSPGMGLGLYISRGMAVSHGGRLDHHDREGGGSVFRVVLPLVSPATRDPKRGE